MDSVLNIILSMSYYFYNLMPLTRGSRYILSFYLDHFNSKQVLTKVLVGPNNQFDPMERTFLNTCSIEGGGRILVQELFCGMNFSYPQWLCLLSGKEWINTQIYQIN